MPDNVFKTPMKQQKDALELTNDLAGRYASLQHSQQIMNRNANQSLNGTVVPKSGKL